MLITCWSVKGGSGTTVVAAALGLVLARRPPHAALLVDLAGDLPAALALAETPGRGLVDWVRAGPDVAADALARLEVEVTSGLRLLPRGEGVLPAGEAGEGLVRQLWGDHRPVVVDAGTLAPGVCADSGSGGDPARTLAASASQSLLVVRPCYLALRRALATPVRPSGLVVVEEPGRALDAADVEDILGVPVIASVTHDPAVARAVDAGLLATRLPRSLARALGRAA